VRRFTKVSLHDIKPSLVKPTATKVAPRDHLFICGNDQNLNRPYPDIRLLA
jgi:hypothetical protein